MPGIDVPTLVSAVLAADGLTITLNFDLTMLGSTGFVFKVNAASRSHTITGTGTSRSVTLSSVAYSTDTVTVDYAPGDMLTSLGVPLDPFLAFPVVNNSTQGAPAPSAPTITGVITTSSGGLLVERLSYS